MLKYKVTIGVLAGLVLLLLIALILALRPERTHELYDKPFILHNMDQADIARLDETVERQTDGKGDYLILIPPIIDGGYWIYDVHSDGSWMQWTVDNTRDGMSSERGKTTYRCREISKQERVVQHESEKSTYYDYELDQCADSEQNGTIIFTAAKEGWR